MKKIPKLIISLVICFSVAFLSSVFTSPAIPTWYKTINKPSFSPPNWIFGPVWTILYAMMAISLSRVWEKNKDFPGLFGLLITFGVQLALNLLWSILFFGLKSPFFAFLCIIMLWLAILLTIIRFYRVEKVSGLLLLPCLFWVSFASVLNFAVWRLNQ